MAQGRQAKILAPAQENRVLKHLATGRYPERDRALFLLSIKAGLRAKEVAGLTWSMITDPDGNVSSTIELEDRASKGRGGRTIPLNGDLRDALRVALSRVVIDRPRRGGTAPTLPPPTRRDQHAGAAFESAGARARALHPG